jgi:hypothetical protein
MNRAKIRGALVGVESVTPEGLKSIFKDFNYAGENLVTRLKEFRKHGVHILGSFIFGLPTDKSDTFDATADLAQRADIAFAQFIMLTPFPGTVDFAKWEEKMASDPTRRDTATGSGSSARLRPGLRLAPGAVAEQIRQGTRPPGIGSQHSRDLGACQYHWSLRGSHCHVRSVRQICQHRIATDSARQPVGSVAQAGAAVPLLWLRRCQTSRSPRKGVIGGMSG